MFMFSALENVRRSTCFACSLVLSSLIAAVLPAAPVAADEASLGSHIKPPALALRMDEADLEALPQHVFSDGRGLPDGSGRVDQGQQLYAQQCAECHGSQGQGGRALELVGDASLLATEFPDRGIAVYWPYAPTLFEYIYRSMPPESPASISSDDMYALIAYLLFINGLVDEDVVLDAETLKVIEMPNVDGFRTVGR